MIVIVRWESHFRQRMKEESEIGKSRKSEIHDFFSMPQEGRPFLTATNARLFRREGRPR